MPDIMFSIIPGILILGQRLRAAGCVPLSAVPGRPSAGHHRACSGSESAEHIRTEFSTYRWLLEPMLAATGFEIIDVAYERRLYGAYTCVKAG